MNWPVIIHLPDAVPAVASAHVMHGPFYWMLETIQGVFWIYAYMALIQRAAVDKFIGMPLVALGLNYGWEFTYSFVLPNPPAQKVVDLFWVGLDTLILSQALRYGRKDYPSFSPSSFRLLVAGLVVYGALLNIALGYELADYYGIYGSLGCNAYMSYAFIAMLRHRNSSAGQSLHVAVPKCIGSAAVVVMFYIMFPGRLLLVLLGVTAFVFDLVYIRLLYRQIRKEGASPRAVNRPRVSAAFPGPPVYVLDGQASASADRAAEQEQPVNQGAGS